MGRIGLNLKSIEAKANKLAYDKIPSYGLNFLIENDCPLFIIDEVAKSFNEGAKKYSKLNFLEEKVDITDYYNAFFRHLSAYIHGEYVDSESGINHLSKFISGGLIIIDAMNSGNIDDNRIFQQYVYDQHFSGAKELLLRTLKWYSGGQVDFDSLILQAIEIRKKKWNKD